MPYESRRNLGFQSIGTSSKRKYTLSAVLYFVMYVLSWLAHAFQLCCDIIANEANSRYEVLLQTFRMSLARLYLNLIAGLTSVC